MRKTVEYARPGYIRSRFEDTEKMVNKIIRGQSYRSTGGEAFPESTGASGVFA